MWLVVTHTEKYKVCWTNVEMDVLTVSYEVLLTSRLKYPGEKILDNTNKEKTK